MTVGVPAPLRGMIGSACLQQGLGTKSLLSANVVKVPVVRNFTARIDEAWLAPGGRKGSEMQEAAARARILADSGCPGNHAHDYYAAVLREREAEIWSKGSRVETDEDGEVIEVEVLTGDTKERAVQFAAVVRGTATPISLHHNGP